MGIASLGGNHFFERFSLMFDEQSLRHSHQPWFEPVPFEFLVKFTTVQAVCCVVIFGITLTPAATVFPLLIGVLIPFRLYVLPKYLDPEVIEHLDPYDKDAKLVTGSEDILKHVHISVAEGQYDPPPAGEEGIVYTHSRSRTHSKEEDCSGVNPQVESTTVTATPSPTVGSELELVPQCDDDEQQQGESNI
jgi:hypothetical protein